MKEDQADSIIELLSELVSELRDLRTQFDEFSGFNVYNMETVLKDVVGPNGYNLGDVNERLSEVVSAIGSLETTIDLK